MGGTRPSMPANLSIVLVTEMHQFMNQEEQKILKAVVEHHSGLLSPAEMFNGIASHDRKIVEKLVIKGYIEEVPQPVPEFPQGHKMLNFYRATEKGHSAFEPWYKKFWFSFKNNTTLYIAIASIIFGLVSSAASWLTVQNSIQANIISEQPFLNFIDIDDQPYQFINSGKGVALNIFLILWDKPGSQLYATPERAVIEAIAPGNVTPGHIDARSLIKTSSSDIEDKLPGIAGLFQAANHEDTSWFSLIYEDIYGRKYATLVRGPGTKEYTKAVEFIDFNH